LVPATIQAGYPIIRCWATTDMFRGKLSPPDQCSFPQYLIDRFVARGVPVDRSMLTETCPIAGLYAAWRRPLAKGFGTGLPGL